MSDRAIESNATAPLRYLFVGGGTGGHLAPALGLAEALQARGHEVRFLGSGRAVERAFFGEDASYHSLELDGSRLPRPLAFAAASRRARSESRRFEPHLVLSLGGLTGATAVAARCGRPLVLLEGNYVVGRAVRWMQPWARTTLTLFPQTAAGLKRAHCVGPIGRRSLAAIPRAEARKQFGLHPDRTTLLLMGGSQGALALNESVRGLASVLAEGDAQLLGLTGRGKAESLRAACAAFKLPALILEHCHDMGAAYSAADLALTRGGAATIAELWLHRLPAIVVPYPHHADQQQLHNARVLEPGVRVYAEADWLACCNEVLPSLLQDSEARAAMRAALQESAPADGLETAAGLLEELAAGIR